MLAADVTPTSGHIRGTGRRGRPWCLLGGRRTHGRWDRDNAGTIRFASWRLCRSSSSSPFAGPAPWYCLYVMTHCGHFL